MLRILNTSKSAMMAQQEKLDSISNNIANINTDGYKKTEVGFQDLVYETLQRKGYPNSNNPNRIVESTTGTGVKTSGFVRDNLQGNLNETHINTDLAIDGEGYFPIMLPDGTTAYTRNGSFNVDGEGNLVDKSSNRLIIEGNMNFKFKSDNFAILENGEIRDRSSNELVGLVNLYNVMGQESLKPIGGNLFTISLNNVNNRQVPAETPYTVKNSSIRQGFLELSNVDMASEMSDMILTQRAFEFSSRGLKTADEMWGMVNNLKGR